MSVADMVTMEGIVPYQTVCRLVGHAPNRIAQFNVVRTFLHNFGIKALNIGLTKIPLFHDEKICTAKNFRKKLLKLKGLNHVQSGSGKRNVTIKLKKKQKQQQRA